MKRSTGAGALGLLTSCSASDVRPARRSHDPQGALAGKLFNLSVSQPISGWMPLHCWNTAGPCSNCMDYLSGLGVIDLKTTANSTSASRADFLTRTDQESSIPTPAQASYTTRARIGDRPLAHPVCSIPQGDQSVRAANGKILARRAVGERSAGRCVRRECVKCCKGRIVEDLDRAVAMGQKEICRWICVGEAGLIRLQWLRMPGQNSGDSAG